MIEITLFSILFPFFVSCILGVLVIPRILLVSHKKRLYDAPDSRKVHHGLIPRLGGISFFPVMQISVCLTLGVWFLLGFRSMGVTLSVFFVRFMMLLVGLMLLYLVGVMDDMIGVSYKSKFLVQIVAASLLPITGLWINHLDGLFGIYYLTPWLGIPLTLLIVVYVTNAINLIDGIDGLASGLCCISLVTLGAAAVFKGQIPFIILCFAMFGILLPFWYYNVFGNAERGRKLFMGDTGSLTLGYLISFIVIYMSKLSSIDFPTGMLMFCFSTLIIPLFDVARVFYARIRRHHNPFLPDKNHIHHKLLRTGMNMHGVLITLLLLSLMFIGVNSLGLRLRVNPTWIFLVDVVLWTCMHLIINHFIRKKEGKLFIDEEKTTTK